MVHGAEFDSGLAATSCPESRVGSTMASGGKGRRGSRMRRAPVVVAAALFVVATALAAISAIVVLAGEPRPTGLIIDYPVDGSIFPPEFTPPTFIWRDTAVEATLWRLDIEFADRSPALHIESHGEPLSPGTIDPRCVSPTNELPKLSPEESGAHTWIPDPQTWETIKKHSVVGPSKGSDFRPRRKRSRARVIPRRGYDSNLEGSRWRADFLPRCAPNALGNGKGNHQASGC